MSLGDSDDDKPTAAQSRKGKSPASKRPMGRLSPAQKTKRNHEKFVPLPEIVAGSFPEAFAAVRASPEWTAALDHAEDPFRGGYHRQFQISNTNKVFTGMYVTMPVDGLPLLRTREPWRRWLVGMRSRVEHGWRGLTILLCGFLGFGTW